MLATNVAKMWIFCYCGELVVTKANEVCEAMYANRWYRLWRKDDLRTVRFVLANTQQNVGFSIGGFRFLSYDAFTEVIWVHADDCMLDLEELNVIPDHEDRLQLQRLSAQHVELS